jgi:hypothetical protein
MKSIIDLCKTLIAASLPCFLALRVHSANHKADTKPTKAR